VAYELLFLFGNINDNLTPLLERSKLESRLKEMPMETNPEIVTDSKFNQSIKFSVAASEERAGLFIIHPVGPISTITYPVLKKEMDRIFESGPEVILFDMTQVNYVNLRGLRVILKTIVEMRQRNGQVYLTNLQPEIKKMFEVMNGALPEWVFESRKLWENYFDAIYNDCSRH
jgi:anti-sigma B factor antagonist